MGEETIKDRVSRLKKRLKALDQSGTSYQVAKLLGVSRTTVMRWLKSKKRVIRTHYSAKAFNLLERVVKRAEEGSEQAHEVLFGALCGDGGILDSEETDPSQPKPKAAPRTSKRQQQKRRS